MGYPWRAENASNGGDASAASWPSLATAEELKSWHVKGYRSWRYVENCSTSDKAAEWPEPTGWFVLYSCGELDTHEGKGKWKLDAEDCLMVEFASKCLLLQLQKYWQGKRSVHFTSQDDGCKAGTNIVGWHTSSKNYKWRA